MEINTGEDQLGKLEVLRRNWDHVRYLGGELKPSEISGNGPQRKDLG